MPSEKDEKVQKLADQLIDVTAIALAQATPNPLRVVAEVLVAAEEALEDMLGGLEMEFGTGVTAANFGDGYNALAKLRALLPSKVLPLDVRSLLPVERQEDGK